MKRALAYFGFAFALVVATLVWAAPRPRTTVTVTGNTAVATHAASEGASLLIQCPSGIVWYRGIDANELADGGSGLITAGSGMTDGGAFGSQVDFTVNSDPIGTVIGTGQAGLAFLGTDAGGSLPCYIGTP